MTVSFHKVIRDHHAPSVIFFLISLLISLALQAQTADGNAGINQANTMVRSYFDTGTQLMYAVGAVLGIIGAIRVHHLWNTSREDATKAAAAWFGSCIFLVVVSTVLKSFFGL